MAPAPLVTSRFSDWPLAVKSILGFWLFYLLTVVARAFLGHDPITLIEVRLVTITIGVVLTFGIYGSIRLFAGRATLRRQAAVAGLSSFVAAAALASFVLAADQLQDKPHDEFQFFSKEGYAVPAVGNQLRIVRGDEQPLVVTWPNAASLPAYDQFRIIADYMVTWLFFFAAWSAERWTPRQRRMRRKSVHCGTRSIRTSCSTP